MPRFAGLKGTIEAREADLPLVICTARGFGQIVFLAADLDTPPLAQWSDSPLLAARLLDLPVSSGGEVEELSAGTKFGYTDMAGQLRSALDQFAGVWLAPFWVVAALVVVYILLIGPADYFFLRKVVGRMQWTWLTFPAVVLVFSLAACVLAYWLKGDRLGVNQIDLVDVDAASGSVRGTSWMNVFSPRTESFDLSVEPRLSMPAEVRTSRRHCLAWLGLPGKGLGGMDPPAASPVVGSGRYEFAPAPGRAARPADSGLVHPQPDGPLAPLGRSSRSANKRAAGRPDRRGPEPGRHDHQQAEVSAVEVHLGLRPLGLRVETAPAGAGGPVGDDDAAERVANPPDRPPDGGGKRRRKTTARKSAVYDQGSTDASYVLRTMMFYEAAGGQRYTGLVNDYQRFTDLSELLKTGSAILVGQAARRPARGRRRAAPRRPHHWRRAEGPAHRPLPLHTAGEKRAIHD